MDRGHPVRAVRADNGQVGHANLAPAGTLLNEVDARHAAFVAWKAASNLVQQTTVDFIDDFQMARQHQLEPRKRPFLECFREQGMIRVGQRFLCDLPGPVPPQIGFIEQNPHQLGNSQGRVSIVELDSNFLWKPAPIGITVPEAPNQIGERAGHQEILLHEAEGLSHARGVVRIQHSGQGFGREGFGQGADEITAAEFLKIEKIGCGCGPEPKRIDGLASIAHHRAIERDANQVGGSAHDGAQAASVHLE